MVFSSPVFLFLFLPLALALTYAAPLRFRNLVLLLFSLLFYCWGEPLYFPVMLASITFNYFSGIAIEGVAGTSKAKLYIGLCVAANLALLSVFKYSAFVVTNINMLSAWVHINPMPVPNLPLPAGISFFTFHALSYVIDIYRRETPAQRKPIDLGLYITFFPQLIAGPILRYHDIAPQLIKRSINGALFTYGVQRFVFGLSKKMLLANPMGKAADTIFALPAGQQGAPLAWLGIVCYSLQIFFDFSGYSDMAIGMGQMFGFRFLENFNLPYIATSIQDFWRRWHISLSTWFRDYLYISLGGNRVSKAKVLRNLLIVFFVTGLWHGAGWNFIIWGLLHGFFLVLERQGLGKLLHHVWAPFRHAYVLLVVAVGWVFFRADTLTGAMEYLEALFTPSPEGGLWYSHLVYILNSEFIFTFGAALLFATSVPEHLVNSLRLHRHNSSVNAFYAAARGICILGLMVLCIFSAASSTYNPFIYYRF